MSKIDYPFGHDSKISIREPKLSKLVNNLLETETESHAIKKLKAHKPIRDLELRENVEFSMKHRATNIDAVLVQIMGKVSKEPCTHCKKEYGPFTQCVSMKDLLLGACASCHYGSEGKRCSFRTDRDEQEPEQPPPKKRKRARTDGTATSESLPTVTTTARVPRAELYKAAKKLHKAAKKLRKAAMLLEYYASFAEKED